MNLSLTPQLEKRVRKKVASGMYSSASEVVREALRLLERRDRLHELRLRELRREIEIGAGQLEAGEYTELDRKGMSEFFGGVRRTGRQIRHEKRAPRSR